MNNVKDQLRDITDGSIMIKRLITNQRFSWSSDYLGIVKKGSEDSVVFEANLTSGRYAYMMIFFVKEAIQTIEFLECILLG